MSTENLKKNCEDTIEYLTIELGKMRSGRASSGLLETINVDYYGSSVPLKQLGLINAPEPRLLTVQVFDQGAVESVEKAIQTSDLGLNPARDGNLIRIAIPALTEERRKDLVKTLHKNAEEAKVAIRNHRREAIDELKKQEKDKSISEDEFNRGKDDVQKVTDSYIAQVDELLQSKEKEMMEV